jgi:hypothetical protein
VDAAEASLKKYADTLAPGVFDAEFQRLDAIRRTAEDQLNVVLDQAKASIDPRAIVALAGQELLELAKTGKSPIKQPPTNLAG